MISLLLGFSELLVTIKGIIALKFFNQLARCNVCYSLSPPPRTSLLTPPAPVLLPVSCGPPHCGESQTPPRVMRAPSLRREPDTPVQRAPSRRREPDTLHHRRSRELGPGRQHEELREDPQEEARPPECKTESTSQTFFFGQVLPPSLFRTVSQCNKQTLKD